MAEAYLSLPRVVELTGLSRNTIYRMQDFPPARQISGNRVAWLQSELDEWMRSRPVAGTQSGMQKAGADAR